MMYASMWQTNRETITLYQAFPGPFLNQLQKKYAKVYELRNADIFHEYFYKGKQVTYEKMAEKYNISPERVRQILQQGLRIIRGSWKSAAAMKQYPEVAAFQAKWGTGKAAFDELLRCAATTRSESSMQREAIKKQEEVKKMTRHRSAEELVAIWERHNNGESFVSLQNEFKMGEHYPNKIYKRLQAYLKGPIEPSMPHYKEAVRILREKEGSAQKNGQEGTFSATEKRSYTTRTYLTPEEIVDIYDRHVRGDSFAKINAELSLGSDGANKTWKALEGYLDGTRRKYMSTTYIIAATKIKQRESGLRSAEHDSTEQEELLPETTTNNEEKKIESPMAEQKNTEEQQAIDAVTHALDTLNDAVIAYAKLQFTKERAQYELRILELEERIKELEQRPNPIVEKLKEM